MEYKDKKFKTVIEGNPTTFHHFKGHDYNILCIAKNSETLEDEVIYVDKDNHYWVRKAGMFFSNVDHEKYPDITQKERFEIR